MFAPSRALRAATQLLKSAPTQPSSISSTSTRKVPTPRQATEPSTPEQWRRVVKHRPPPVAPVLPTTTSLRLPKPPFIQIRQPSNSPPLQASPATEPLVQKAGNAVDEGLLRKRKGYAASQDLARRVCNTAVTELLVDAYPKLSAEARTSLAIIARHYRLDATPAGPKESSSQRRDDAQLSQQAELLRSYLAAIHAQEGERFAYQWIRQCLRSVLSNHYAALREQQKNLARAAREKEILSPMSHLRNFVRHHPGLEPVWNIAVKGDREEYRAEVALVGLQTSGTANTIRMAKQNAADKLMQLIWRAAGPEDIDPDLPDYPKLLVLWASQSEKQKPQFDCKVEKAPVVRCTLDVQGQQFVERGLSKRAARFLAARSAVEALEIDLSTIRLQPLRRPSQVRRREKFQQLLAQRAEAAKTAEAQVAVNESAGAPAT
ncbi:hypothetical protein JCM10908_002949 [Rhodotorula pacifica]|uniref:double-stranded RNA binding motif domain-containing protein n=1 Tax=Rhodotorula pacifica TaxID=1495444 RepID=UPI003177FB16